MSLSVIIPSRTVSNLIPCVEAVRKHEPNARVIVVDDGLEFSEAGRPWQCEVEILSGRKPFCFARNMNIGIKAAGQDNVILLNDDALLDTPGGFTAMALAQEQSPEFGVVSAATNLAGNPQQMPRNQPGIRPVSNLSDHSAPVVAFVCVYIPHTTIDRVGLLDERFGGERNGQRIYGFDDNDYCRRTHNVGLRVGVFDGCFVDHSKLRSTFRGDPKAAGDIRPAWAVYLEKWGTL